MNLLGRGKPGFDGRDDEADAFRLWQQRPGLDQGIGGGDDPQPASLDRVDNAC